MTSRIVALVGRPNVGKSTLFNRLVGRQEAIVEDIPGTTRDRLYGEAEWNDRRFIVVDTGGMEVGAESEHRPAVSVASEPYVAQIRSQAEIAIDEADVVIMVADARQGMIAADEEVADVLRRSHKPVILAVNKADNDRRAESVYEFYQLGLGTPYAISALHGLGVGDLLDEIVHDLPAEEAMPDAANLVRLALVGRPNVGKSSLLNTLLGEERAIVSDIPGTTRDAIDTYLEWEGQPIVLIDTAGIRRRGKVDPGIEKYSVLRSLRAIARADVVLLLLDATQGVTAQDAHVASYILEAKKSVVVVVNKWDLVIKDTYTMNEHTARLRAELKFLDYVPVIFISAKTRQRVNTVVPTALRVQAQRVSRVPTAELNRIMAEAVERHSPPSKAGRRLKFYYASQAEVNPPTFVFFVNDTRLVHFSYQRYIENRLREQYAFEGTPLQFTFRQHEDNE
jgi:GTP-binding protein